MALVLAATAVLKIESGHTSAIDLPVDLYYATAIGEFLIAGGIVLGGRARRVCLMAVVGLCVGGSVWSYWFAEKPCGCLGTRLLLSNAAHMTINAVLGIASLLATAWLGPGYSRRAATNGPAAQGE